MNINEQLLVVVEKYSKIENVTPEEFLNMLLKEAIDNYFLRRSGGAILTLPNPQNYIIDSDSVYEGLKNLVQCAEKNDNLNLPLPLYAIADFFSQRLLFELEEDKKEFRKNLIMDRTQCENFTEDIMSVRKED